MPLKKGWNLLLPQRCLETDYIRKKISAMKIINILGGLGNQMFQYAFALSVAAEYPNEDVKLNTLCFKGYPLHNGYELDQIFNITLPYAKISDLIKVAWPWAHYRIWQVGRRLLPNRPSMCWDKDYSDTFDLADISNKSYFDGYWQSPRFFNKHRNAILKAFQFPPLKSKQNQSSERFIKEQPSAFIHVRRGDYVHHPIFGGICTLDYYDRGINLLKKKGYKRFVIFSNDIDWCKANLVSYLEQCDVLYIDWNKGDSSYIDMQLMSMCEAGIIANSSFSWWGAWLSSSKLILAPNKWTNIPGRHDDILENGWIKL